MPNTTRKSRNRLAALIVGDAASIRRCVKWLLAMDRYKRGFASTLRQYLDCSTLPQECKDRAAFDLRNQFLGFNELLVEGLNVHLRTVGTGVRDRFDPYAKALLSRTHEILGRPPAYDEKFFNLFLDRFGPALNAFGREAKLLFDFLTMHKPGVSPAAQLVNESRDAWLYKECCNGTKYSVIELTSAREPRGLVQDFWRRLDPGGGQAICQSPRTAADSDASARSARQGQVVGHFFALRKTTANCARYAPFAEFSPSRKRVTIACSPIQFHRRQQT